MALSDYPKLEKLFNELQDEKSAIQAKSSPLREKRDELQNQIAPIEVQIRELNQQIKGIEQPVDGQSLADIDMQISQLARMAGGKRLSDGNPNSGQMFDSARDTETIDSTEVGSMPDNS